MRIFKMMTQLEQNLQDKIFVSILRLKKKLTMRLDSRAMAVAT